MGWGFGICLGEAGGEGKEIQGDKIEGKRMGWVIRSFF